MTENQWRPFCERYLCAYFGVHPQFEDIISHAVLAVWRVEADYAALEEGRRRRIAGVAAWRAACDFLRSAENLYREHNRHGTPILTTEPLDMIAARQPWRLVVPDFAPRLIAQLAARERLAALGLTPIERRLLVGLYLEERSGPVMAEALALSVSQVERRARKLAARLRAAGWHCSRRPENPSGYRGVRRNYHRFLAGVRHGGRFIRLGGYATAEEAALAVDAAILAYRLQGELNLLPEACRGH